MVRIFVIEGREFPDPDPNRSVDEVRQSFMNFFPELFNSLIKESKRGEDDIIEFSLMSHDAEVHQAAKEFVLQLANQVNQQAQSQKTVISTKEAIDHAINQRKTGLSESALATYKTDWHVFAKQHSTLPQEPQPVRDYIYGYANPRTRAKIYSELCSLYECTEQLGSINVMPQVEPPPRIEALPVHHTEAETRDILAKPRTPKETALVQLIEVCGLRIGEASSMNVGDVGSESISFRGKTFRGKTEQRELYLPQEWIAPLTPLCHGRGPEEPLFVGQRGRLTTNGLRRIYEMICQRAGIPEGRRHPHCGRHSAGTHLIEAGCDQFTVQQLLGHKRLDMTSHYVHLAQGKKARERLERYSITATGEKTPDTRTSHRRHTFSTCRS